MRVAKFRNKACPFCGSKKIHVLEIDQQDFQYTISDPKMKEKFEKEGKLLECSVCDYVFHENKFYEEFANRTKTPIDKEDYLFDLGEKVARFCGQENAMYHCLMHQYIKENREVYYQEDIDIDFAKMMRRVRNSGDRNIIYLKNRKG